MREEKEFAYFDQLIAGALSKLESIDNVDFSLLVEDYKKKNNNPTFVWSYDAGKGLSDYIEIHKDGIIKLKESLTLDFIGIDNCTVKDKLKEIAKDDVNNYFNNFDVEEFKKEKEKRILENKEKVLNNANVLLISDIQEDYDELVKYGFKNVDYFKSIVRADEYFAKHPEELEKYHIILKGHQSVQRCCFGEEVELDQTIHNLQKEKHILDALLSRYDYTADGMELVSYLNDKANMRSWTVIEKTYKDFFDRIVENILINHTLEKVGLKDKKFEPIRDYINPNRLPLPTKKSDLKILYLDSQRYNDYVDKISKELGLNICFREDSNYGLDKYVKSNLGKFDIIIVTETYSRALLNMNNESTEQCKDTGRELTLLMTQDDICWRVVPDSASEIKLMYSYGGNLAPDLDQHSKEFRALLEPVEVQDENWNESDKSEYSNIKSIVSAAVNLYNQALLQQNKAGIKDINFKSAEEFEQDYVNDYESKKAIKEAELAPIRDFDAITSSVKSYLDNIKNDLIDKFPEGLEIHETADGIKVSNIYNGIIMSTIVFPKKNKKDNLRIFDIQTTSKKGYLLPPQTVGLYTSEFEGLESVPNRPNEAQEKALLSIQKKINYALQPLNDEAWNKKCKLVEQKNLTLNRNRKNRRRR